MMLAMYSNPLLGNHASRKPQPKTHRMFKYGMKSQATMCLPSMQVDCNADNSYVGYYKGVY